MKKKILGILQLPPPVHGASMMNEYLVKSRLINQEFDLEIVNLQFNKSIKKIEKFSFGKIYKALGYAFVIVKKTIQLKPDLVYFTISTKGFSFYRDALYIFLIKRFRPKVALHFHSKGLRPDAPVNFVKKYLYRKTLNNTYRICLSPSLKPDIANLSKLKTFVVSNGIPDSAKYQAARIKKDDSSPVILYLSNYIESKGILILIEAMGLLKKRNYDFRLRLVGAPGNVDQNLMNELIQVNNLSSSLVETGPLYGDDKYAELSSADIFVFPTCNDAFPLVLLEAMQFRVPVISTFEGGIPDMIKNDETGILVEKKNTGMLAEKIALLLDNPSLRVSIGEAGYQRFKKNYRLQNFEENICTTFHSILGISPAQQTENQPAHLSIHKNKQL